MKQLSHRLIGQNKNLEYFLFLPRHGVTRRNFSPIWAERIFERFERARLVTVSTRPIMARYGGGAPKGSKVRGASPQERNATFRRRWQKKPDEKPQAGNSDWAVRGAEEGR